MVGAYTAELRILPASRSAGMNTTARIPARAAAATAAARFPVDAQANVSNPNARARVTAMDTGRSLNEKVGLTVSFLMYRLRRPHSRPRLLAFTSGVQPA